MNLNSQIVEHGKQLKEANLKADIQGKHHWSKCHRRPTINIDNCSETKQLNDTECNISASLAEIDQDFSPVSLSCQPNLQKCHVSSFSCL